jgi:type VI secretion system secreted protein Hcp
MRTSTMFGGSVLIEALEGRMMLSAAPAAHHPHPHHTAAHAIHKPAHHKSGAGADPIFMQINGLAGDVAVPGFAGDIELNSFQWGVGRGISSPTGGSSDRESSAPSVSEIVVTKALDKTSPELLRDLLAGTDIPEIDIFFVNLSKGGQAGTAYAEYVLSDVLLSGYSTSSGGDRPTESLSLNFLKIQYKSFTQNADGTTSVDSLTYDLTLRKLV